MAKLPATFNWKESIAHLSLLSMFQSPRQPSDVYGKDGLGESVKDAIERLKNQGAILPGSLEDKITYIYTVADLKSLLKAKGEKTAGKKEELITRLIQVDRTGMETATRKLNLFRCSDLGLQVLEEYAERQEKALEEAQAGVYQALYRGDFSTACKIYKGYTKKYGQPFWYDPFEAYETKVKIIDLMKYAPKWTIERYGQENLRYIQVGLAMKDFWHEKTVWECLPDNFPVEYETVQTLIPLLERYQQYYNEVATNLGADYFDLAFEFDDPDADDKVCESCRQLDGLILDHRLMPDWPFDGCQNEIGCLPESCHSLSIAKRSASEDLEDEPTFDEMDRRFEEKVREYRYSVHLDAPKYLQEYRDIRRKLETGKISGEKYLAWLAGYFPDINQYESFVYSLVADHIPGVCWADPDNTEMVLSRRSYRRSSAIVRDWDEDGEDDGEQEDWEEDDDQY